MITISEIKSRIDGNVFNCDNILCEHCPFEIGHRSCGGFSYDFYFALIAKDENIKSLYDLLKYRQHNKYTYPKIKPPKTNNMNNKAELQKKLADLKAEIEQTEKLLAEPEVPTIDELAELYKPKWLIDVFGVITYAEGDSIMKGCYKDRETAEREALRCQFILIAHHCNGGWKWDGKSNYFSIKYEDGKFETIKCYDFQFLYSGEIIFKSREAAKLAIKIFGQDNLKKMNSIS